MYVCREEKAEMLTESREELEQLNTVLTKLKAEVYYLKHSHSNTNFNVLSYL